MTAHEQLAEVRRVSRALFAIEETLPLRDGSDLAELRRELYRTRIAVASFESRTKKRIDQEEQHG